jgi:hypothetical protein
LESAEFLGTQGKEASDVKASLKWTSLTLGWPSTQPQYSTGLNTNVVLWQLFFPLWVILVLELSREGYSLRGPQSKIKSDFHLRRDIHPTDVQNTT